MSTNEKNIKVHDVVQVDPEVDRFGGCLVIVTELKAFGVQGFVEVPAEGRAFIRLKWDQIERIGQAVWAPDAD